MEFQAKSIESALLDETCENFLNSSDVIDALDMWVRGFHSDESLVERLKYLRQEAAEQAERKVFGPDEDPDNGPWEAA